MFCAGRASVPCAGRRTISRVYSNCRSSLQRKSYLYAVSSLSRRGRVHNRCVVALCARQSAHDTPSIDVPARSMTGRTTFAGQSPHAPNGVNPGAGSGDNSTAHTESLDVSDTSLDEALKHVGELLPHQPILERFVHHNPLALIERMSFRHAISEVVRLEQYTTPGERLFALCNIDPRKRMTEALVDLSAAFLDRGVGRWTVGSRDQGFLYFFATLEGLGKAPWRKHARTVAEDVIRQHAQQSGDNPWGDGGVRLSEEIIHKHLDWFGIPPSDLTRASRSILMEMKGWAGMFHRMEHHPDEAPAQTTVRLVDFYAVHMILLRSSIESLAREEGWEEHRHTLSEWMERPLPLQHRFHYETVHNASAVAYVDQDATQTDAIERRLELAFLKALNNKSTDASLAGSPATSRPAMQLYTCIDDRECSLRRHVESEEMQVETFGVPGFFGFPLRYRPLDGRDEAIHSPEGRDPREVVIERAIPDHVGREKEYKHRQRLYGRVLWAWEKAAASPIGSIFLSALFPVSLAKLAAMTCTPTLHQKVRQSLLNAWLQKPTTDFEPPYSTDAAASSLARTFRDIGTQERFAPLIVVLGHGAASENNPFAAAYNCGACGGNPGGVNARVFARYANDPEVRSHLLQTFGISVPQDTVFIGGLHNTTNDEIALFDEHLVPNTHSALVDQAKRILARASGQNALERCNQFLLADVCSTEQALRHVQRRSVDISEVRPELNHATNAAVVVGRRSLTRGRSLDGRVFLSSYDPFSDDDRGTNLEDVMGPALVVCSGINLEYLFSTVAVNHYGAGTKAPLNVVSNIGVQQGTAGDLRPGLPSQMTEMHTPVRALFMVDAPVERVEQVLRRRPQLAHIAHNEWVRMFVRDPRAETYYHAVDGRFEAVDEQEDIGEWKSFDEQRRHGLNVVRRESLVFQSALAAAVAACAIPIYSYGDIAMNPYGSVVALSAGALTLPVLLFSRRYLHGEPMYDKFFGLSVALLLGFNLVATAPTLTQTMAGWSLFGFASTFLIGSYNERSSVRNNATFAFAAYRISDFALLTAATFAQMTGDVPHALVASSLLLAALFKSSQFPLTSLFVRSMEGPTPTSALGYAGLSAHVGVVLLANTMPLWFPFDWARLGLAGVGLYSAVHGSLVAKVRTDRKGAVAQATSATLGLIFVMMAAGFPNTALTLSLGHAAFRIAQILRAPNSVSDAQTLRAALGFQPWPQVVPDWLYRFAWRFRRMDSDIHMTHLLHRISSRLPTNWKFTKRQQWALTASGVVLAGAPFTPFAHALDETLMDLLVTHPVVATIMMAGHFGVSVLIMRFLLGSVLRSKKLPRADNPPTGSKKKV